MLVSLEDNCCVGQFRGQLLYRTVLADNYPGGQFRGPLLSTSILEDNQYLGQFSCNRPQNFV